MSAPGNVAEDAKKTTGDAVDLGRDQLDNADQLARASILVGLNVLDQAAATALQATGLKKKSMAVVEDRTLSNRRGDMSCKFFKVMHAIPAFATDAAAHSGSGDGHQRKKAYLKAGLLMEVAAIHRLHHHGIEGKEVEGKAIKPAAHETELAKVGWGYACWTSLLDEEEKTEDGEPNPSYHQPQWEDLGKDDPWLQWDAAKHDFVETVKEERGDSTDHFTKRYRALKDVAFDHVHSSDSMFSSEDKILKGHCIEVFETRKIGRLQKEADNAAVEGEEYTRMRFYNDYCFVVASMPVNLAVKTMRGEQLKHAKQQLKHEMPKARYLEEMSAGSTLKFQKSAVKHHDRKLDMVGMGDKANKAEMEGFGDSNKFDPGPLDKYEYVMVFKRTAMEADSGDGLGAKLKRASSRKDMSKIDDENDVDDTSTDARTDFNRGLREGARRPKDIAKSKADAAQRAMEADPAYQEVVRYRALIKASGMETFVKTTSKLIFLAISIPVDVQQREAERISLQCALKDIPATTSWHPDYAQAFQRPDDHMTYLQLRQIFDAVDEDGGGELDREEIRQIFHDVGIELSQDDLIEIFARIDQGGDDVAVEKADGSKGVVDKDQKVGKGNGRIEFTEWAQWMMEESAMAVQLHHAVLETAKDADSGIANLLVDVPFNSGQRFRLLVSVLEASPKEQGCGLNLSDMMFRHGIFAQMPDGAGKMLPADGCFPTALETHFPLHCAEELAELRADWGSVPLAFAFNGWYPIGVEQPIDKVREYFGEKIALYFAWMEVYSKFLFLLGFSGCITFAFQILPDWFPNEPLIPGYGGDIDKNPYGMLYAVFVALTSVIFTESWKRRQNELHFRWGLQHGSANEPIRPQCKRTKVKNVVTGRIEENFDSSLEKKSKMFVAAVLNLGFMAFAIWLNLIAQWLLLEYHDKTEEEIEEMGSWEKKKPTVYGGLLTMVVVVGLAAVWSTVAKKLTDWENWERQSEFDNALVVREITFQFVNFYFSLFYVAFGKWGQLSVWPENVFAPRNIAEGSRMPDLQLQLFLVFSAKMYGKQVANFFKPVIILTIKKLTAGDGLCGVDEDELHEKEKAEALGETAGNDENAKTKAKESALTGKWLNLQYWLEEYNMPGKPTCYDDWVEMTIQFGFLVLFSPAFPLGPLMAWIGVVVELRLDATSLCRAHQRPRWESVENIGTWEDVLATLTLIGVVTNSLITSFVSVQTENLFDANAAMKASGGNTSLTDAYNGGTSAMHNQALVMDLSDIQVRFRDHRLWLFCIGLEHAVLLARVILGVVIPDEPEWVSEARNALEVALDSALRTNAEKYAQSTRGDDMSSGVAREIVKGAKDPMLMHTKESTRSLDSNERAVERRSGSAGGTTKNPVAEFGKFDTD